MERSSTVIDYLERRFYKDDVAIAFLYCNYKEQETQTLQALIGSLIQQLVQRHRDIPTDLKDLYERHARNKPRTPPTLRDCLDLLKSQLARCPKIFLVIDALDECEVQTRTELCAQLQNLPESIHLLITSRPNPELENDINSSARLEILANDNDIEIYLEDQIERVKRLKGHTQADPELRLLIKRTIRDNAQGMYVPYIDTVA
jgi:hypothetical protein